MSVISQTTLNVSIPEFKIVGIMCRTSNFLESDPSTAQIQVTTSNFINNSLSTQVLNQTNPNQTYCVYTNYENKNNGMYDFIIGNQVSDFFPLPEGFAQLIVPIQNYTVFTSVPGSMPLTSVNLWNEIGNIPDGVQDSVDNNTPVTGMGGNRGYLVDYEIDDSTLATDPLNTVISVYIGVTQ